MRFFPFAVILFFAASPLFAATGAGASPYLALGDSVSFGYIANAGYAYVNPDNFVGFPDYAGQLLQFNTTNTACPGETSGSFLSSTAPDNGCHAYRAQAQLHVRYPSTQLSVAVSFLRAHPATPLVSVGLGANDVFLLAAKCANNPTCIDMGLPQVLAGVQANLTTILADLRAAGFKGVVVVVNYYSPDYADSNQTATTAALNQALANAASTESGTVVADVFSRFQAIALSASGHTCNAGLLNASAQDQTVCDVHPSQSGQKLIARTIEDAYAAATKTAP